MGRPHCLVSRAGLFFAGAASLFVGLSLPRAGLATVVVPMTIEDMTKESECVVRGRVVSSESAWDREHSKIYTSTEVTVLDPIHVTSGVPTKVVVRTLGGEVGSIGMKVAGTERFVLNEEVLLFLRKDPLVSSAFQVVGMSQGKYRIEAEAKTGRAMAVPSVEGLAFVRPDDTGILKVDPSAPQPSVLSLSDLKRRVLAAVADLKPGMSRPDRPTLQAPSPGPQGVPPGTSAPPDRR